MKPTVRTYYDADSTEGRPTTRPPASVLRKWPSASPASWRMHSRACRYPSMTARTCPARRYIARMRLTPAQLKLLVRMLGNSYAGGHQIPADDDHCKRYGCSYREYRAVVFFAYREALSLLVATAPRSRLDLDDLLEILMAWPGALPLGTQTGIASAPRDSRRGCDFGPVLQSPCAGGARGYRAPLGLRPCPPSLVGRRWWPQLVPAVPTVANR